MASTWTVETEVPVELSEANKRSSPEPAPGGLEPILTTALGELTGFAESLALKRALSDLRAGKQRLDAQRLNLVVLGEFKRGKSSLINALLELELLPTGVLPLTSVVTVLGAGGSPRLLVRFIDGREAQAPVDELPRFVTEAENPDNELEVDLVRVEVDHRLLAQGIELVDTPGIASIHAHNTAAARDFFGQVDAALFVLDASQPFSQAERELVMEVSARAPKVILAVNKIDMLSMEDRRATMQFIAHAAQEISGAEPAELIPVSAREGEGVAALRRRLGALTSNERRATLSRSLVGIAAAAAAEIAQAARLERSVSELPIRELQQRTRLFEQRIRALRTAEDEAATLLEHRVAQTLKDRLDEPLERHAEQQGTRLRGELDAYVAHLGAPAPNVLSRQLEDWICEKIKDEFAGLVERFESDLSSELSALQSSYATRVQEIVDGVQRAAGEAFGESTEVSLPHLRLREPTGFSFKLADPAQMLDLLAGRARTLVPGKLGRRMVVAEASQRLLAMTDRHAGRLRSELHARVIKATSEYRKELVASVHDVIEGISGVLARAGERGSQDELHSRAILFKLREIERRSSELQGQLTQPGW